MKILLVDDHALFRDGLSLLLHNLDDDVRVIEAGDSISAFEVLSKHSDLDFMLLDLNIPGTHGFSTEVWLCRPAFTNGNWVIVPQAVFHAVCGGIGAAAVFYH